MKFIETKSQVNGCFVFLFLHLARCPSTFEKSHPEALRYGSRGPSATALHVRKMDPGPFLGTEGKQYHTPGTCTSGSLPSKHKGPIHTTESCLCPALLPKPYPCPVEQFDG